MTKMMTHAGMSPVEETDKKRISRKLLWWAFGLMISVCVMLMLVIAAKSGDKQQEAEQKKKEEDIARVMKQGTGTADDIAKIKADQEQAAKEASEREAAAERFRVAQQQATGQVVPEVKMSEQDLDRYAQSKAVTAVETDEEMRRDMVVFQEDKQSIDSGAASQQQAATSSGSGNTNGLVTPEQMAQQAQRNATDAQARSAQFLAQSQAATGGAVRMPFMESVGGTAIKAPVSPQAATSKYVISEGTPIAVITTRMINSDLPGTMEARVTRDVYDTITNEHLLIPMGSRLVGPYNAEVIPGQDRVEGGFTRLIFPNGASIALDGAGMADRLGQSGLDGTVNNHFFRQLALQFVVAGIAKVAKLDSAGGSGVNVYAGGNTTSTAGQILTDTMSKYSSRYMNMKPTITVPEATIFNVIVSRDMHLPPAITVAPNQFVGEQ